MSADKMPRTHLKHHEQAQQSTLYNAFSSFHYRTNQILTFLTFATIQSIVKPIGWLLYKICPIAFPFLQPISYIINLFPTFILNCLVFVCSFLPTDRIANWINYALTSGYLPDVLLQRIIRYLLRVRYNDAVSRTNEDILVYKMKFVEQLKRMPIAIQTQAANEQHYELPAQFYQLCLGSNLKYSCCFYSHRTAKLDEAELAMFSLYCERAQLTDGQRILDLGCGWGSLSLYIAQRYPNSTVIAVSNSHSQREFIETIARQRELTNLTVITCDINALNINDLVSEFDLDLSVPTTPKDLINDSDVSSHLLDSALLQTQSVDHSNASSLSNLQHVITSDKLFDRIVSIEMMEHCKNYEQLFHKLSSFLKSDGKLFVHIFTARTFPYHFEVHNATDWMAKYFFSGGTMPSMDLFLYFQQHLTIESQWYVNGKHYGRTAAHWRQRMERNEKQIRKLLAETYGSSAANKWYFMWRTFYMSVEELFNYEDGEYWGVSHYLFSNK